MIFKNLLKIIIKYPLKNAIKLKTSIKSKCALTLGGTFLDYIRDKIPFLENEDDKFEKYWKPMTLEQVIQQADQSFEDERYMDVYESLNKVKYSKDIDVVWRLARALFSLSMMPQVSQDVRKHIIEEAYEILETSKETGKNQADYHKWMAVISNRRNGLESLETQIRGYPGIRDHLVLACNNNCQDFTAQYMLGRWHYEMANMTWLQRKIAKYLFQEPPKSTYQEAYKYLHRAEELNPRWFLPNVYMLGARYYLNLALNLPTQSKCEECCASNAKNLLDRLEKYHLGMEQLSDKIACTHGFVG